MGAQTSKVYVVMSGQWVEGVRCRDIGEILAVTTTKEHAYKITLDKFSAELDLCLRMKGVQLTREGKTSEKYWNELYEHRDALRGGAVDLQVSKKAIGLGTKVCSIQKHNLIKAGGTDNLFNDLLGGAGGNLFGDLGLQMPGTPAPNAGVPRANPGAGIAPANPWGDITALLNAFGGQGTPMTLDQTKATLRNTLRTLFPQPHMAILVDLYVGMFGGVIHDLMVPQPNLRMPELIPDLNRLFRPAEVNRAPRTPAHPENNEAPMTTHLQDGEIVDDLPPLEPTNDPVPVPAQPVVVALPKIPDLAKVNVNINANNNANA